MTTIKLFLIIIFLSHQLYGQNYVSEIKSIFSKYNRNTRYKTQKIIKNYSNYLKNTFNNKNNYNEFANQIKNNLIIADTNSWKIEITNNIDTEIFYKSKIYFFIYKDLILSMLVFSENDRDNKRNFTEYFGYYLINKNCFLKNIFNQKESSEYFYGFEYPPKILKVYTLKENKYVLYESNVSSSRPYFNYFLFKINKDNIEKVWDKWIYGEGNYKDDILSLREIDRENGIKQSYDRGLTFIYNKKYKFDTQPILVESICENPWYSAIKNFWYYMSINEKQKAAKYCGDYTLINNKYLFLSDEYKINRIKGNIYQNKKSKSVKKVSFIYYNHKSKKNYSDIEIFTIVHPSDDENDTHWEVASYKHIKK